MADQAPKLEGVSAFAIQEIEKLCLEASPARYSIRKQRYQQWIQFGHTLQNLELKQTTEMDVAYYMRWCGEKTGVDKYKIVAKWRPVAFENTSKNEYTLKYGQQVDTDIAPESKPEDPIYIDAFEPSLVKEGLSVLANALIAHEQDLISDYVKEMWTSVIARLDPRELFVNPPHPLKAKRKCAFQYAEYTDEGNEHPGCDVEKQPEKQVLDYIKELWRDPGKLSSEGTKLILDKGGYLARIIGPKELRFLGNNEVEETEELPIPDGLMFRGLNMEAIDYIMCFRRLYAIRASALLTAFSRRDTLTEAPKLQKLTIRVIEWLRPGTFLDHNKEDEPTNTSPKSPSSKDSCPGIYEKPPFCFKSKATIYECLFKDMGRYLRRKRNNQDPSCYMADPTTKDLPLAERKSLFVFGKRFHYNLGAIKETCGLHHSYSIQTRSTPPVEKRRSESQSQSKSVTPNKLWKIMEEKSNDPCSPPEEAAQEEVGNAPAHSRRSSGKGTEISSFVPPASLDAGAGESPLTPDQKESRKEAAEEEVGNAPAHSRRSSGKGTEISSSVPPPSLDAGAGESPLTPDQKESRKEAAEEEVGNAPVGNTPAHSRRSSGKGTEIFSSVPPAFEIGLGENGIQEEVYDSQNDIHVDVDDSQSEASLCESSPTQAFQKASTKRPSENLETNQPPKKRQVPSDGKGTTCIRLPVLSSKRVSEAVGSAESSESDSDEDDEESLSDSSSHLKKSSQNKAMKNPETKSKVVPASKRALPGKTAKQQYLTKRPKTGLSQRGKHSCYTTEKKAFEFFEMVDMKWKAETGNGTPDFSECVEQVFPDPVASSAAIIRELKLLPQIAGHSEPNVMQLLRLLGRNMKTACIKNEWPQDGKAVKDRDGKPLYIRMRQFILTQSPNWFMFDIYHKKNILLGCSDSKEMKPKKKVKWEYNEALVTEIISLLNQCERGGDITFDEAKNGSFDSIIKKVLLATKSNIKVSVDRVLDVDRIGRYIMYNWKRECIQVHSGNRRTGLRYYFKKKNENLAIATFLAYLHAFVRHIPTFLRLRKDRDIAANIRSSPYLIIENTSKQLTLDEEIGMKTLLTFLSPAIGALLSMKNPDKIKHVTKNEQALEEQNSDVLLWKELSVGAVAWLCLEMWLTLMNGKDLDQRRHMDAYRVFREYLELRKTFDKETTYCYQENYASVLASIRDFQPGQVCEQPDLVYNSSHIKLVLQVEQNQSGDERQDGSVGEK